MEPPNKTSNNIITTSTPIINKIVTTELPVITDLINHDHHLIHSNPPANNVIIKKKSSEFPDNKDSDSDWPMSSNTDSSSSSDTDNSSNENFSDRCDYDEQSLRHWLSKPRKILKEIKIAAINEDNKSTSAPVEINGHFDTCLLDSGASTTMVSTEFAELCNIVIKPISYRDSRRWKSASGNYLDVIGRGETTIIFGSKQVSAEVMIVNELVHNLIVGTDIMLKHGFIIDYESRSLKIGNQIIKIKAIGYDEPAKMCLALTFTMPAKSIRSVWLKTKVTGPFLIESDDRCELTVVEGVKEANDDGIFAITMKNVSEKAVYVKAGSVVCSVVQVNVEGSFCDFSEVNKADKAKINIYEKSEHVITINSIKAESWKPSESAMIDKANMSEEMALKYSDLLDKNFDVFSKDEQDIGAADFTHEIKLIDNSPFKSRAYRIPTVQVEIVDTHIKKMLEMGVIRESSSPYASPIVLVKKNDGSIRFCIDYRKLNKVTIKDCSPMPLIEERIDSIFGSIIFSGLDLTSGYWQFRMTESAMGLTAFICHLGLFEFLRMPFGLCNAGATFQRAMEEVVRGLKFAMAYIDDLLVHSKSHEEHLEHLQIVFDRLRLFKLKIKLNRRDTYK